MLIDTTTPFHGKEKPPIEPIEPGAQWRLFFRHSKRIEPQLRVDGVKDESERFLAFISAAGVTETERLRAAMTFSDQIQACASERIGRTTECILECSAPRLTISATALALYEDNFSRKIGRWLSINRLCYRLHVGPSGQVALLKCVLRTTQCRRWIFSEFDYNHLMPKTKQDQLLRNLADKVKPMQSAFLFFPPGR